MSSKRKRIGIKDIAEALNVTPSTVSRALNSGDRVSKAKRKEIIDLANKWGYRPNLIAKSMQQGKTFNIALLVPNLTHHFFDLIMAGVEHVTCSKDYHLIIGASYGQREKEIISCKSFIDAQVDGIIAAIGNREDDFTHFTEIIDADIPLVLVDRICEEINVSYVTTNDFEGAFSAVNHLIETGCKRIVHIKGADYISTSFNRWMGYQEALKRNNIPYDESLVLFGENAELENCLEDLLKEITIDGIFAFSDYHANVALNILKKRGLSVPKDVSIIGYADEPIANLVSPKLSTVHQPAFEMGIMAGKLLFDQIEKGENTVQSIELDTKLVLRETTI